MGRYVFTLVLVFLVSGCMTLPTDNASVIDRDVLLKSVCKKENVLWQWDGVTQVVTLSYQDRQARALVGSDIVVVDGERIQLNMPLSTLDSSIIVPSDFRRKVIYRLKKEAPKPKKFKRVDYPVRQIREVVIDAGHGGKDPGAIGRDGLHEKKVVLDIALRLKKLLVRRGLKVRLTRDDDTFISLNKRTELTSKTKADLFISIHANASLNKSVSGIEVFAARHLNASDRNEQQRKTNQRLLLKKLSAKKNNRVVEDIVEDMLYVHKQNESFDLAKAIVNRTARYAKIKNRGVKQSRFFVLRNTLIPAVLVEVGFLSNSREGRMLRKSGYRQKLAQGIAKGIFEYVDAR